MSYPIAPTMASVGPMSLKMHAGFRLHHLSTNAEAVPNSYYSFLEQCSDRLKLTRSILLKQFIIVDMPSHPLIKSSLVDTSVAKQDSCPPCQINNSWDISDILSLLQLLTMLLLPLMTWMVGDIYARLSVPIRPFCVVADGMQKRYWTWCSSWRPLRIKISCR